MNARDPGIPKLNQGPLGPLPGHAQLDLEHFLPYRLSVLSNRVSGTIAPSPSLPKVRASSVSRRQTRRSTGT